MSPLYKRILLLNFQLERAKRSGGGVSEFVSALSAVCTTRSIEEEIHNLSIKEESMTLINIESGRS